MVISTLILTGFLIIVTHFIFRKWKVWFQNSPPGPLGLPIVGYSLYLQPRAFKALMKIKSKYPDIAQVDFGVNSLVVLNSYETIKEALSTKGDNFSGRQTNILKNTIGFADGIVGSDGEFWKEHRRFAMRTLRDFGLGKNQSEQIIHVEIQHLLEELEKERLQGDGSVDVMELLLRSVSNVICTLCMGEQPGYENEKTIQVINRIREMLNKNPLTAPPLMFPALFTYMGSLAMYLPRVRFAVNIIQTTVNFLQINITKHYETFDPTQQSRDYIESFLLEKHKRDSEDGKDHTFTDAELRREIFELFVAGTDTTSNSLSWGFLLLALHPEIQKRCHDELDAYIGRDRLPTMKDKEKMPYIQAVLDEIQRYATIVPLGVLHRNFEDDTIKGYHIAKDTLIIPFVYGVHHDSRVWERPDEFYPDHFLSSTSVEGKCIYYPRDELIPFLIGKRECLGISLARMEFFLFFVRILQKYEMDISDCERCRLGETLLGSEGPVHSPGQHKLVLKPRC